MTSLDTSRTQPVRAAAETEPRQDVERRTPELTVGAQADRDAAADSSRSSPDPMHATDRYRLMMPYVDRI